MVKHMVKKHMLKTKFNRDKTRNGWFFFPLRRIKKTRSSYPPAKPDLGLLHPTCPTRGSRDSIRRCWGNPRRRPTWCGSRPGPNRWFWQLREPPVVALADGATDADGAVVGFVNTRKRSSGIVSAILLHCLAPQKLIWAQIKLNFSRFDAKFSWTSVSWCKVSLGVQSRSSHVGPVLRIGSTLDRIPKSRISDGQVSSRNIPWNHRSCWSAICITIFAEPWPPQCHLNPRHPKDVSTKYIQIHKKM